MKNIPEVRGIFVLLNGRALPFTGADEKERKEGANFPSPAIRGKEDIPSGGLHARGVGHGKAKELLLVKKRIKSQYNRNHDGWKLARYRVPEEKEQILELAPAREILKPGSLIEDF